MTKEEAKSLFKQNLREMQRKGLPHAFDIDALIDHIIDAAFEWAKNEVLMKPTFRECVDNIKQYAKDMNGEVNITIKL